MEQIIKFGISNYLQLCVEAGFSQIQSHIIYDYSITNDKMTSLTMKATPGFLLMKFNSVVCGKYPLIRKFMIILLYKCIGMFSYAPPPQ